MLLEQRRDIIKVVFWRKSLMMVSVEHGPRDRSGSDGRE